MTVSAATARLPAPPLCAFDLLQVDGRDLRRQPLEARKRALAKLLRSAHSSLVINTYYEADGAIVFREACRLGCEGIVSKRLGSPYRSGRTAHWIKVNNPKAPAVKREAEEDVDEMCRPRRGKRRGEGIGGQSKQTATK